MANDLVPANGSLPTLVDAQGRALQRQEAVRDELSHDIAGASVMGARSIQTGHPGDGLTPERLARILRQAENGDAVAYLELAEQMEEKDLHYLSVLGTRKRAVAQEVIWVEAASDDPNDEADAQLVRDWLERDTLEAEIFDMLDSVGKGFSVTEMIWDTSRQPWLPVRLETRDQRWFEQDRIDGRTLRLKTERGPQLLSPAKYIIHESPAKTGLPIRGGLARPVAWAYLFRNYSVKDWVRFNEAFGMPLRVAKYENGTDEANVRKMLRALLGLSADFAAAFPKSADVEFVNGAAGGDALFERMCLYFEAQISKAVLGQTATTDSAPGGLGSGAQASTHNEVRGDIKRADAKALAATLNRDLVKPIVLLNRGRRGRFPRLRIGQPDEQDVETFMKAVAQAVAMGVPVSVAAFRKGTGLAEPKAGEELLTPPATAAPAESPQEPQQPSTAPAPRKTGSLAFLAPLKRLPGPISDETASAFRGAVDDGDGVDRGADAALNDWQRLVGPVLAPIEALVDGADSLEDFRARLAAAAAGMDVDGLVEQLARGAFAARLAGDVETPEDGG